MNLITTGVEKGYYSIVTEGTDGKPVFGPVKYWPGLREMGIAPKEESATIYAENMLFAIEKALGDIDVDLDFTDMPLDIYCDIFGKKLDQMGGVIDSSNDVAKYICFMAEKTLTGGVKEYIVLYKGQMNLPEDKAKTKEGKPEFQTKPTNAKFMPLPDGTWRYTVRSDNPKFNAATWATTWGKTVYVPVLEPVTP